ncbi:head GIN domain-containing protein [Croceitalea rosinachiae]|uniref:Head GIN domain-containing protein n=1 Tax=Croceitalea rosinachiae TaxID=3075596 RepID=A0ABU3A857_9FLAO|nr:head GIN domain-containing protein [Croceitalea sp. F388]MDT0606367.1 head GIN domain-containing protein [Croceitalea sp. F388]
MKSSIKNSSAKLFILSFALLSINAFGQLKKVVVDNYDKIIVSPHIAVTFIKGDSENVEVHTSTEPLDKLNIEVVGSTLRLYLDGAKTYTDGKNVNGDNYDYKVPIYKGTVITATVTYKSLKELSLRGEEKFACESIIEQSEFQLKLYGESEVYFNEVHFDNLTTTIYGESYLELKNGTIDRQKITAYGETTINTLGVKNNSTKITAFGEGSYRVAVKERLKVTAYGEATIAYEGSPEVKKGIVIGEATIQKIN